MYRLTPIHDGQGKGKPPQSHGLLDEFLTKATAPISRRVSCSLTKAFNDLERSVSKKDGRAETPAIYNTLTAIKTTVDSFHRKMSEGGVKGATATYDACRFAITLRRCGLDVPLTFK